MRVWETGNEELVGIAQPFTEVVVIGGVSMRSDLIIFKTQQPEDNRGARKFASESG